jgi:hypothetical protein
MRDAPRAAALGTFVELLEVARLRHGRVGDPPDECSHREIAGNQCHGIGERYHREMLGGPHAGRAAQQVRMRQDRHQHQQRDAADHATGHQGRGGA